MILRSLIEYRRQISTKNFPFGSRTSCSTFYNREGSEWFSFGVDELCALFRRIVSQNFIFEPHLLYDFPCAALHINVLPVGKQGATLLEDGDFCTGLCQEPCKRWPSYARPADKNAHCSNWSSRDWKEKVGLSKVGEDGYSELEARTGNISGFQLRENTLTGTPAHEEVIVAIRIWAAMFIGKRIVGFGRMMFDRARAFRATSAEISMSPKITLVGHH